MAVEARGTLNNPKGYVEARTERDFNRNGLKNITQWKQTALDMLLSNEQLLKALYYNVEDWHNKPNLTDEQKHGMIGENIYPYRFISQIGEKKKSYISMDIANFVPLEEFRLFSNDYIHGYLYFYILVDFGIMMTDMGVRSDIIVGLIYDTFQKRKDIGMGELNMETTLPLWTDNNHYGGYTIGFKVSEMT